MNASERLSSGEALAAPAAGKKDRWARLEVWAEYLHVPRRYLRQKLQDVLAIRRVTDRSGKLHLRAETAGETQVAERVPEYAIVEELQRIGKTREEIRKILFTRVLAQAGYPDRRSLERGNRRKFESQKFLPYKKGKAFYAVVTGKTLKRVTKAHLLEIADLLFPKILEAKLEEEKPMDYFRKILAEAGYPDRRSLETVNPNHFKSQEFPPYGKGRAFYTALMGRTLGGGAYLTRSHLLGIADMLGFPKLSDEETRIDVRKILAKARYPDRRSLETAHLRRFSSQEFPPYGKGHALYSAVTGKTLGRYGRITRSEVFEIADSLFPEGKKSTDFRKILAETGSPADFRKILADAGYPDRRSLEKAHSNHFRSQEFPPYGKGRAFYTAVMGRALGGNFHLNKAQLLEIASLLFPQTPKEEKPMDYFRKILAEAGYPDRRSLDTVNPDRFRYHAFPPYGKGRAFYVAVAGKTVKKNFTKAHLLEVADILWPPEEISNVQEEAP